MWVEAMLKAPDAGPWIALTHLDTDGSIRPLGYVQPATLREVADYLRTQNDEAIGDGGWPVEALAEFVAWADTVEALRPQAVVAESEASRSYANNAAGFRVQIVAVPSMIEDHIGHQFEATMVDGETTQVRCVDCDVSWATVMS